MKIKAKGLAPLLLSLALAGLFAFVFFYDNKYQAPPPYGRGGVIQLTEADLTLKTPLFLIDGWLLTDKYADKKPVYIGQFSNLRRKQGDAQAHGDAKYELVLKYSGQPVDAVIDFPQLFTRHEIYFDGVLISKGMGGAQVSVRLSGEEHRLEVKTSSSLGFYSGMYHPAMIGTAENVTRALLIKCIAYCVALLVPLVLALFTLALWWRAKDYKALWFGLLCIAFSAYVSYYFVRLFKFAAVEYWFIVQCAAFYALCYCVLRLICIDGDLIKKRGVRIFLNIIGGMSAILLMLAVLIPAVPIMVNIHNGLTNVFCIAVFCGVAVLAVLNRAHEGREHFLTRLGCVSFAVGLICYLLGSGFLSFFSKAYELFEPILMYWQFEWCALFLVVLFAGMMAARNKRIMAENAAFETQLEDMVRLRTQELRNVLQERKAFFADMAHDLKAPLYAAESYIQAIREHGTGVDTELLRYIDMVEKKQQEVARRVQGLNTFNKIDELTEPFTRVSVNGLLDEIAQSYRVPMRVQSILFIVLPPDNDGYLYASPQKLRIMFENLIFNALRATPPGGSITVSAEIDEEGCHFSVEDTGCGIPPEELEHIFDRFFVGKQNAGKGSGLGLYIVKSIVDEMQGEISISSKPGQGVIFYIDLPLAK